jgi:hypothetical protein
MGSNPWQEDHSEQALDQARSMTYLQGECSHGRAEEKDEIQRRFSASPPGAYRGGGGGGGGGGDDNVAKCLFSTTPSYRRVEEEEEDIQRRSSARSQLPPYPVHGLAHGTQVPYERLAVVARGADVTRRVWRPRQGVHRRPVPLQLSHRHPGTYTRPILAGFVGHLDASGDSSDSN